MAAGATAAMFLRRGHLGQHPPVFRAMTGPSAEAFGGMLPGLLRASHEGRRRRPQGRGRRRAGGGDAFGLDPADQLLLTAVWLRHYPTQGCPGHLFGVSDSSALRAARRRLPLLEAQGKGSTRLPDPGKGHRRDLPALLKGTPPLAVSVDAFERRTHRPRRRQRAWYSGKKEAHALKSQAAVGEDGRAVDVGPSRPGPTAGLKVFRRWGLAGRLARAGAGALGGLAYVGIDGLVRGLRGAAPRRRPRRRGRPPGAGATTGPSRGAGSRWSMPPPGCGATGR